MIPLDSDEPSPVRGRAFPLLRRVLLRRPITALRAAAVITFVTVVVTVLGGVVIWLTDRQDFSTLGSGIWWALQTVSTVGYGDVVPSNAAGRLIAAVVMLTGIAFVSVVTAAVTAMLIEQLRRRGEGVQPEPAGFEPLLSARLDEIGSRLEAIEASLAERGQAPRR